MANSFSPQSKENSEGLRSQPEQRQKVEQREAKELQSTAHEFRETITGVEAGIENAEVSEGVGEDRKKGPAVGMKTGAQGAQKKAAFQFKIPNIETMRHQIAREIKRQIRVLEHQAKKMSRNPAKFSPFVFAGVISKIRELKSLLANLANITFETLKGWWMKFVKNISI